MDVARLAEGLHAHTAGLADAVAGADPDAMVPTCPEWPIRVLVGHVGSAHRWAASVVAAGAGPEPEPLPPDAPGPGEWSDWLREGATLLADAVAAADGPVWTFFGPRPAAFWSRRMRNDTTVHHADAALATGTAFTTHGDIAADVIGEWLAILSDPITPTLNPEFAQLRGTGQTIQLRPDTGTGWLITRTPDGVRWERATGAADTTLAGPVTDLMLVLTRRIPVDRVTVTGDRTLAEHWLAHTVA